nr:ATP-binding cassette domain-containing protein [Acinetobacter baumannii]
MAYITLRDVQLAFGGPALLDGANFNLERGERVCLIGRNGEGKSTLLLCTRQISQNPYPIRILLS